MSYSLRHTPGTPGNAVLEVPTGGRAVFASGQVGLQITGRLSVRPGKCETDLDFVGLASWVPGGGGRLSVYSM